MMGLVIFGGADPHPDSNFIVVKCAFTVGFSKKACLGSWLKVGAAPCTMVCLNDKKARRKIGDSNDEVNVAMRAI